MEPGILVETLSCRDGTTISPAGFDPRLIWFQADGTQMGNNNGGRCCPSASYLGACKDAYIGGTLVACRYVLALMEKGIDLSLVAFAGRKRLGRKGWL